MFTLINKIKKFYQEKQLISFLKKEVKNIDNQFFQESYELVLYDFRMFNENYNYQKILKRTVSQLKRLSKNQRIMIKTICNHFCGLTNRVKLFQLLPKDLQEDEMLKKQLLKLNPLLISLWAEDQTILSYFLDNINVDFLQIITNHKPIKGTFNFDYDFINQIKFNEENKEKLLTHKLYELICSEFLSNNIKKNTNLNYTNPLDKYTQKFGSIILPSFILNDDDLKIKFFEQYPFGRQAFYSEIANILTEDDTKDPYIMFLLGKKYDHYLRLVDDSIKKDKMFWLALIHQAHDYFEIYMRHCDSDVKNSIITTKNGYEVLNVSKEEFEKAEKYIEELPQLHKSHIYKKDLEQTLKPQKETKNKKIKM